MRVLTSSRPEWSASSTSRAFCGSMTSSDRFDQGTASSQSRYVRITDDSALWSPSRSKRDSSRSACSLDVLGHAGVGDLLAVVLGDRGLVLAELLADGVHLLAQEVVALLLLGAVLDVLADALAHLQLGQPLALELQRQRQALHDVERLEQLELLRAVQVGRVAGRVGQRARLGDRADEGADAAVVAAQLEDLLDHGAVLALEVGGQLLRRRDVGVLVHLDAQHAVLVAVGAAGDAAVQRVERHHVGAADGVALGHLGDDADPGVADPAARDQQHPAVVAGDGRNRDGHAGEHHGIVERNQGKGSHERTIRSIVDDVKY